MRFHEPDVREAFRSGARDLFDALANDLKPRRAQAIESWLRELDAWDDGDPPSPPFRD
jgi:hypothetical protein